MMFPLNFTSPLPENTSLTELDNYEELSLISSDYPFNELVWFILYYVFFNVDFADVLNYYSSF